MLILLSKFRNMFNILAEFGVDMVNFTNSFHFYFYFLEK